MEDTTERYYYTYVNGADALHSCWVAHYMIYKAFLDKAEKVNTLDLCCGSGPGTKLIATSIGCSTIGTDYSQEALDYAGAYNFHEKVSYYKIDLNDTDKLKQIITDKEIKQIFFVEAIEHIKFDLAQKLLQLFVKNNINKIFISTPFGNFNSGGFHVNILTRANL